MAKPTKSKAPPVPADDASVSSESSADEMVLVEGAGWDEDHSSSSEDESDTKDAKKRKSNTASSPQNYDFTLEEMSPDFSWSVRTMLSAEPFYSFKAADLTDKIVDQASVGTVITQPADEPAEAPSPKKQKNGATKEATPAPVDTARSIFGFATLLNPNDTELTSLLPPLLKPLGDLSTDLATLLAAKKSVCGVLISNILINLPHTLTQSLHTSLLSDVAWAQANATGEGGAERELYKFSHVVVVSQLDSSEASNGEIGKDAKGRYTNIPPLKKIIDEYFMKYSVFEPFVKNQKLPGGEASAKYLVGAIKYSDLEKGVKEFGAKEV